MENFRFINEEFVASRVGGTELDVLLSEGWRHFGERFFRYNLAVHDGELRLVTPLRIRIADFRLSKSQRRTLARNADLITTVRPSSVTPAVDELFDRHRRRFDRNVPESIFEFLSREPAEVPCQGMQVSVSEGERLVAVSFFDVGHKAISGIYAVFDPEESERRLGIHTMLCEIEHARRTGCDYYYHGYAYRGESFYDYKKRFSGLEMFDWESGLWREYGE